jgi:hypothetical protein
VVLLLQNGGSRTEPEPNIHEDNAGKLAVVERQIGGGSAQRFPDGTFGDDGLGEPAEPSRR